MAPRLYLRQYCLPNGGAKRNLMLAIEELAVQYVTNDAGKRSAVIIPIKQFEALLEDLADLAIIAERRDEATIPHKQLKDALTRDGYLSD